MSAIVNTLQTTKTEVFNSVANWLDKNPKVNTVVVIANHVFRALSMYALMEIIPGTFVAKCAITLGASLFYRVTIERFCKFRFALLSCVGAVAIKLSLPTLNALVSSVALPAVQTLTGIAPLVIYLGAACCLTRSSIKQLNNNGKAEKSCCMPQPKPVEVEKPVESCCCH